MSWYIVYFDVWGALKKNHLKVKTLAEPPEQFSRLPTIQKYVYSYIIVVLPLASLGQKQKRSSLNLVQRLCRDLGGR